jgi:hypothetical protein
MSFFARKCWASINWYQMAFRVNKLISFFYDPAGGIWATRAVHKILILSWSETSTINYATSVFLTQDLAWFTAICYNSISTKKCLLIAINSSPFMSSSRLHNSQNTSHSPRVIRWKILTRCFLRSTHVRNLQLLNFLLLAAQPSYKQSETQNENIYTPSWNFFCFLAIFLARYEWNLIKKTRKIYECRHLPLSKSNKFEKSTWKAVKSQSILELAHQPPSPPAAFNRQQWNSHKNNLFYFLFSPSISVCLFVVNREALCILATRVERPHSENGTRDKKKAKMRALKNVSRIHDLWDGQPVRQTARECMSESERRGSVLRI